MIMGFALLWAGLFLFAVPGDLVREYTRGSPYIAKRMEVPLLKNLGLYILFTLF